MELLAGHAILNEPIWSANDGVYGALTQQQPDIFYVLGRQIAERLRNTTRKAGDLAFLDISGRVARTLIDLCKQPDALTHPDGMQIKITRQEIGRIVGCTREMVGRVLKMLEAQELIYVKGKTMVVFGTRTPKGLDSALAGRPFGSKLYR